MYGSPRAVVASPPTVALEFYDKDTIVSYIIKATRDIIRQLLTYIFSICHTKHVCGLKDHVDILVCVYINSQHLI